MSLELEIQKLTDAVQELTGAIETLMQRPVAAPVAAPVPAPVVEAPAPVAAPAAPVAAPVAAPAAPVAAPVMPAAPTFEPPAPTAPAASKAPFTDGKGLITYVMDVYKQLGAEKGAGIQGVLTEMGLTNVNDVRPTEYDTFFAKVEALK